MAQFLVLFLILADAFVLLATANATAHIMVEPNAASFSNPPSPAEAPAIRKLGKHNGKAVKSIAAPSLSPSEAPQSEDVHSEIVQGQQVQIKKLHRSIDKSVAGGGVILGGLATTFLVAVFCYIRATGRKNAEPANA